MAGRIEAGPTLMPSDAARYEPLAQAFATNDRQALLRLVHPFAAPLPMIPEKARETFRASLSTGQNHATVYYKGMLLDGRNRTRELTLLRKPIRTALFVGTDLDALEFVKAENIERRHLDESQRADYAARISTVPLGTNQHTMRQPAQICAPSLPLGDDADQPAQPTLTQSEAAEKYNVSRRSVQHAVAYQKDGIAEISDMVQAGEIKVSVAAEIAARPVEEQRALIDALPRDDAGKLTPEAKKEIRKVAKEVRAEDQAAKKQKRQAKEAELGAKIAAKPDGKFGVVLEDFEWDHEPYSRETGMDRHPANHYPTAADAHSPEEIVARTAPRFECADDICVLYMWTTIPHCAIAVEVIRLRGFSYKSQRCWDKVRNGDGRGPGYWVTGEHELLLIATRGNVVAPDTAHFPSRFEAPVGKHSEKPDQQYEHAEFHFPNTPKIELNARRPREGWKAWGYEAPAEPTLALDPAEAAE